MLTIKRAQPLAISKTLLSSQDFAFFHSRKTGTNPPGSDPNHQHPDFLIHRSIQPMA